MHVGNLIFGSSAFYKPSLNIWKLLVYILLKSILENYEHVKYVKLCGSLNILWHCLSLELEWKLTFSSPVATAEFAKFAGILNVALSQHHFFRIWNSSTGIPSPPLPLFVVMLPKARLTSHSIMYGSRWVITLLWLSGSWRFFWIVFCVFLPLLLNIFFFC